MLTLETAFVYFIGVTFMYSMSLALECWECLEVASSCSAQRPHSSLVGKSAIVLVNVGG